jgi:hypothetical protein
MSLAFAILVFWTPSFRESNGEYPYFYYAIWIAAYYLQQVNLIKKKHKNNLNPGLILLHFPFDDGI